MASGPDVSHAGRTHPSSVKAENVTICHDTSHDEIEFDTRAIMYRSYEYIILFCISGLYDLGYCVMYHTQLCTDKPYKVHIYILSIKLG